MKKHKNPPRSMTAITLMLSIAMLLIWGVSMVLMTAVSAGYIHDHLYSTSANFVNNSYQFYDIQNLYSSTSPSSGQHHEYPGLLDYRMLDAIRGISRYKLDSEVDPIDIFAPWKALRDYPMEAAVIFYDQDGNILHKSGNFLYFYYVTEEEWKAGKENEAYQPCGWIDIGDGGEDDPYARFRMMYRDYLGTLNHMPAMRITGTVEGTQVKPVTLHYLTYDSVYGSSLQWLSTLDKSDGLDWQLLFDNTASLDGTEDLVTIYALSPEICLYEGSSVEYLDRECDTLVDLAEALGPTFSHGDVPNSPEESSIHRILDYSSHAYVYWGDYDPETDPPPEMDFNMVVVSVSYPLKTAVSGLRYLYLATGVLALIVVLLLRRIIKKRLIHPIGEINTAMAGDWWHLGEHPRAWRESQELRVNYNRAGDHRRYSRNEITRLNTALDYAKQAEQNRRQLTSHIAHELKTPLAVIHSYAEGLKEHIAEEKRDQYLDVILSETARMDGMVLEMLDLSRLEAGKVKLARDTFDLSLLTRSICEKFAGMAAEKGLQVTPHLAQDCTIAADEARISQVITNFLSNAVRYTPEGGTIHIRTTFRQGEVRFSTENTSRHFTPQELTKVWEPFYQADKSRHSKGTGLGLAIARNIIDLHSGKCYVENTPLGVEFGFILDRRD